MNAKKKVRSVSIWLRKIEHRFEAISIFIFALAFVTKVLGFIKLRLIANTFGASRELDIFWASFTIPDLIFMLIIGGSTNAALIPAFIRLKKKNPKKLRQTFNMLLFLTLILWLGLWGAIAITVHTSGDFLINILIKIMQSKSHVGKLGLQYSYYTRYTNLFANLTTLMFLSSMFLALSSVIGAYLLSFKRFLINNLSPLLYNLGIILGLIYVAKATNPNVYGLAWAIILGSLLHFGVQFVFLACQYKQTLQYLPKDVYFILKNRAKPILKEVKHIFIVALPRMLGIGIEQITVFFNTFWALLLGGGALSIFKYALSLHFLPIHLIGNTIAQAVFPSLNETREGKNGKKLNGKFTRLFHKSFLLIFLLSGYIAVIIFVLKTPIVQILLQGGKFGTKDVYLTSLTLGVLVISIIINSLMPLVIRVFYVLEETFTPFLISIFGVIINIVLGVLFSNLFGYPITVEALKQIIWNFNFRPLLHILPHTPYMMLHLARGKYSIVGLAFGMSLALIPEFAVGLYYANKRVQILTKDFWNKLAQSSAVLLFSGFISFLMYKYYLYHLYFMHMNIGLILVTIGVISTVALIPIIAYYWFSVKK